MIDKCLNDLKMIIEQNQQYILIKIMIDCWDKEIDFNIVKVDAIKKKLQKIGKSKLGYNFQWYFGELPEIFNRRDFLLEQKKKRNQFLKETLEKEKIFICEGFCQSFKIVIY